MERQKSKISQGIVKLSISVFTILAINEGSYWQPLKIKKGFY